MKLKKFVFIMLLIVALSAYLSAGRGKQEKIYKTSDVDEIFENIRQTGPVYEWTEEHFSFQHEGMNVVCTIVVPQTPYKPPIAITLNGFGEDRNYVEIPNTGGEHFYERLSRILAEQGIATLRIDFRGSGDSDGSFSMTTFSSQASDTVAAIDLISNNRDFRARVDKKRLGLVGFSQGGLIASLVASQDDRVDSIVICSAVASPPITYEFLLTREGIHYGDFDLGRNFFVEVTTVNPLPAISKFPGPMMCVAGKKDIIVWPQPYMADMFMTYHEGFEKLVVLDTDHEYDTAIGAEEFDKTLYWTAAWFLYTL